ncbi:MAG TPA: sigma-70 family RNA polymerase sigma factor [Bryobacteraceae bacterium]|jgi:RNA polymerase sigma-70 factor (ECF subfamily)|nr:sigma-70 family RNA polymerase sigma factor [Bryobacteraceae bacterium]
MPEHDSAAKASAFDHLYREQGSPIRRFLRLSTGDESAADDLTQETFLDHWRRPHAFNPARGGIKAYLLGIARRKAADWWRAHKAMPAAASECTAPGDNLLIRDALNQLPEEARSLLWLREVEGYSYDELAQILKIPIGTVRSRLHSARQQLRTIWMKERK